MSYNFLYEGKNVYECDTIPTPKDVLKVFELLKTDSKEKLLEFFNKVDLICLDSDNGILLSDSLKNYFNINIEIERTNYIYQNKVWYKLTDEYINTLNEIFEMIKLNYQENDIEFEEWNNDTETEYINKYQNKDNFYKIHPRLEDEIEVCDLMYIDRKNKIIKLLYLKQGFGASTRDLAIQTTMGVKRLNSLIYSDERLKKFYNKYIIEKNPEYQYSNFKEEIKTFLKNAIIVYKLRETEKSNIGKQSIIFAKNEIELMGKCKFSMKQL